MFFRSIRIKLFAVLALLAAILALLLINFLAAKKIRVLNQTYAHIMELSNDISFIMSQDINLATHNEDLSDQLSEYAAVRRSCTACHEEKADLFENRVPLIRRLSGNRTNSRQIRREVALQIETLKAGLDSMQNHHRVLLRKYVKEKQSDTLRQAGQLPAVDYLTSTVVSELSVIYESIEVQRRLFALMHFFNVLESAPDIDTFGADFLHVTGQFYEALDAFQSVSFDVDEHLLVEELRNSSKHYEQLFTVLINLEGEYRSLRSELLKNQHSILQTLENVAGMVRQQQDRLTRRIDIMERSSHLFVIVLLIVIFLQAREIIRSLGNIVGETKKIESNFSYRIHEDPAANSEVRVVFRALNEMAESIGQRVRSLHREITVRTQTEKDLSEEKERLAVTLRSIGDGVITTDISGNVVLLNRMAETLTGWTQAAVQGKMLEDIFTLFDAETGAPCGNSITEIIHPESHFEPCHSAILKTKDGNRRHIADSGAPIKNSQGEIIGAVLVFRDISEKMRMEEEILKARKLESLGILAGGIAHDFNNILAAILGNINLAIRFAGDRAEAVPLLEEAEKATVRARDLTLQLLTFSKGGEPIRKTASIAELVRESADFILRGSSVKCRYHIPDDLWLADIDKGQMSQVVQNLIINARQAMPDGGGIDIICSNEEDISQETFLTLPPGMYIKVVIRDSGKGIAQEHLDKIFDPFFSTKPDGSGLGLAITHSIITKHEGGIYVQSEAGKGTAFTFYLPASFGKQVEEIEKVADIPEGQGNILLMDDDEMILNIGEKMLSFFGYTVQSVRNGEEAIDLYKTLHGTAQAFDAVVMDLTIPGGMGGKDAAAAILSFDPAAKLIVASGYSNDLVVSDYQKYGFKASISKPFDMHELARIIHSVLQ